MIASDGVLESRSRAPIRPRHSAAECVASPVSAECYPFGRGSMANAFGAVKTVVFFDLRMATDVRENATSGEVFDLLKSWRIVAKHRWLVLGTFVAVLGAVLGWNLRRPKVYQAQATVIIEPNAPQLLGRQVAQVVELGSGPGYFMLNEYYNTQTRILKSRSLAERVVRKFELHKDGRLVPPSSAPDLETKVDAATTKLQASVVVLPVKDSRVFGVGVRHTDPSFSAELTNRVVETYTEQNVGQKLEVTRGATRWVAEQLDAARDALSQAERALHTFKNDNNILSVSLEDRQNILANALQEFSKGLSDTKKNRIDLESRQKAIAMLVETDALDTPMLPRSGGESAINALEATRSNYLEERRKLAQLEERYGPKHPEVVYLRTRVEASRADLDREAKKVLRAMEAEIRAAQGAEGRYSAEVERLTREALKLNEKEIQYKTLVRDADNAAQTYTALLRRFNESGLQEQDNANNIRILDRALVPTKAVEPNMQNAALLGGALALILGLGLGYLKEFLDRTIKSQDDIEATTGLPVLGMIPSVDEPAPASGNVRELYIMKHPNSTAAESCRVLRTNLLFCSPDKPLRSLVVTSSNPVEGKTMTIINLGVVMAQAGHRTLIVDSDMRRPRVHKVLKVGNDAGLSNLIVGERQLDQVVRSTELPNLMVLPCGPIPPNPAELLQTERFVALVRMLTENFDRVLFDSPPLLAVTDAAIMSRVVDGTLLIARAGRTARDAFARAKRHVDAVNAHVVGAVLNDINVRSASYSGYYQYYQYYAEPQSQQRVEEA